LLLRMRKAREEWKVYGGVFDKATYEVLFRLAGKGLFDRLESPLSIGKESNVFSAVGKHGRVAVKIYRVTACDFNRMYDYIRYDPRFRVVKKRRKVVFAWALREYRNLFRARNAGVRVPAPFGVLNNVLVEEFIGYEDEHGRGVSAPKLKDAIPEDIDGFFNDLLKNLKLLYKAGLVHGDLSAFNILNHDETPVLIDLSQGTVDRNPYFNSYWERDVKVICNFFNKIGLKVDPVDVLKEIKFKK